MAAMQFDVARLSTFYGFPQPSFEELLKVPTKSLVEELLQHLSRKADEVGNLASDHLRVNVELDSVIRNKESKIRTLKAQAERDHAEAEALRRDLLKQEQSVASTNANLRELQTSAESATLRTNELQDRIDSLEASNRNTVALLDSKNTAYDDLTSSLAAEHQKNVDLRREVATTNGALEAGRVLLSNVEYKEQSYKQSIDQLEKNVEWLSTELKSKTNEQTKFRREKNDSIAQLQRRNEELSSLVTVLQRTEARLQTNIREISDLAEERSQKYKQIQDDVVRKEQANQVELDAVNRLSQLRETASLTDRARAQELTIQLETLKQQVFEEIGNLTAELETVSIDKAAFEAKVASLESSLEESRAHGSGVQSKHTSDGSDKSRRFTNGSAGDPSTPKDVSTDRSVISRTHLLEENLRLTKSNADLKSAIDDFMHELEVREPEFEEVKRENIRLADEVHEMSALLEEAGDHRDIAHKDVQKQSDLARARLHESQILRQQLRDFSSQIKILLIEAQLASDGAKPLESTDRAKLEYLLNEEQFPDAANSQTDTDTYISTNLVTFKNIAELQEQNSKLLKITREIGARMESEESLRKEKDTARNWEELEAKYERCRDEIKTLMTQSQSYVKERDMFRRMLSQRGFLIKESDAGLQNTDMGHFEHKGGMNAPSASGSDIDDGNAINYTKVLNDMSAHFDSYKQEAAVNSTILRSQIDGLSTTNNELRSEALRSQSQATLASERYEMLHVNYAMLKTENQELQKRSSALLNDVTRQDSRVQQVAEDLIEAKGLVDSFRNENANLKAEKEFWKGIEQRLVTDNENLLNDRLRLSSLNASLQSSLNEREHLECELRSKLDERIKGLERDLESARQDLNLEREDKRQSILRNEFSLQDSQSRIDRLTTAMTAVKEELAKSESAYKQRMSYYEELTRQPKAANEADDGPRSQQSASHVASDITSVTGSRGPDTASSLQDILQQKQTEAAALHAQIEQYKSISQSTEDELSSFTKTQRLYEQEMNKLIDQKDAVIKELENRLAQAATESTNFYTELTTLREQKSDYQHQMDASQQKHTAALAQVQDLCDRNAATAQYYQEDLQEQARIAQRSQTSYEQELVKHADAAKALQKLRDVLNSTRVDLLTAQSERDTTNRNLVQNSDSWKSSQDRMQREILDMTTSRDNLKEQNDHLHAQLEELTHLKRHVADLGTSEDTSMNTNNYQEIVRYLRREKEITEVQVEVLGSEVKRLKQQLDYTHSQLDESRLKLSQQIQSEASHERSQMEHTRLLETIHDLNTHREANMTLRNENQQHKIATAVQNEELERLRTQLEPLKLEVSELKNKCEVYEGERKLLKENAERWQSRTESILQKYDRIDPAEFENLKIQNTTLDTQIKGATEVRNSLQAHLDDLSRQLAQAQEQSTEQLAAQKARLTDQFKGRSKTLSDRIKDRESALQTASTERQALETRLSATESQVISLQAELETARVASTAANPLPRQSDSENGEDGEIDDPSKEDMPPSNIATAKSQDGIDADHSTERAETIMQFEHRLLAATSHVAELESRIASLKAENERLQQLLNRVHPTPAESGSANTSGTGASSLEAEHGANDSSNDEMINLSFEGDVSDTVTESITRQVKEHITAVRQELEKRNEERMRLNDENYKKRLENMKGQLIKRLSDGKAEIRESLSSAHEAAVSAVRTDYEQQISQLLERHAAEILELKSHENARTKALRAAWDEEMQKSDPSNGAASRGAASPPGKEWQPTEQEARNLVQTSETLKNILRRNIHSQIEKSKTDLSAKITQEQESSFNKRLNDAADKAGIAKDHAVMMEGKKSALQVNMANNKVRVSQYRLDMIQKAASDRPTQHVGEVWKLVKDAKPPQTSGPAARSGIPNAIKAVGEQPRPPSSLVPPAVKGTADQAKSQELISAQTNECALESTRDSVSDLSIINKAIDLAATTDIITPRPAVSQVPALKVARSALPIARGSAIRGNPTRGRGALVRGGGASEQRSVAAKGSEGVANITDGGTSPSAMISNNDVSDPAAPPVSVPNTNKRPREESQDTSRDDGSEKKVRADEIA